MVEEATRHLRSGSSSRREISREPQMAYRLHYSCQYSGSLLRRSKWTVRWSYLRLVASNDGWCREEHEVRLIKFVRSKKARIYWDNRNITHLFRKPSRKLDKVVTFAWQAGRGEILEVISRSDSEGKSQYEFYIDGISFTKLPHVEKLGRNLPLPEHGHNHLAQEHDRTVQDEAKEESQEECENVLPPAESHGPIDELHLEKVESLLSGDNGSGAFDSANGMEQYSKQGEPASLDFRLAMAGFGHSEEVVDELRSDLYTRTIDVVRDQITQCIPQTEEMVSRAIMNAFCTDDESHHSGDSSLSGSVMEHHFGLHPIQFETDAVAAAYEWVDFNRIFARNPDVEEQKLEFLQKQINAVMLEIRRDRLCAPDACQALLSVACVLGLEVNLTRENTTIVLKGLDKAVTQDDLFSVLKKYGEIAMAGVSTAGGIGLCRYCYPASVDLATQASAREEIFIMGKQTEAFSIYQSASSSPAVMTSLADPELVRRQEYYTMDDSVNSLEKSTVKGDSTVLFHTPDQEGHLAHGSIEKLIMKTSQGCLSNRTVSTLDSDSETGTCSMVRYTKVLL